MFSIKSASSGVRPLLTVNAPKYRSRSSTSASQTRNACTYSSRTVRCGAGQRQNDKFHTIVLNSLHCACALHDDGFQIVLPDITVVEASEPATRRENPGESASSWLQKPATPKERLSLNGIVWSFWPRKPNLKQDNVPNTGNVMRNGSAERQAALERRQERLRGRILGMKRVGLTDFKIAEL